MHCVSVRCWKTPNVDLTDSCLISRDTKFHSRVNCSPYFGDFVKVTFVIGPQPQLGGL